MSHRTSTKDPKFRAKLQRWLRRQGELFVMIRHPYAAGSKDFEFFTIYKELGARLRKLKPGTWLVVFKEPQLPVRGVVDEALINACVEHLDDGAEFLISERTKLTYGRSSWFNWSAGRSHAELRQALEKLHGQPVAVGRYPAWMKECDGVVSAIVPDETGAVRLAVY
jgi:hypothetical protein